MIEIGSLYQMKTAPDLATKTTADLAEIHRVFHIADEFYRLYRKALLNLERHQGKPQPKEWIPLSNH